MKRQAKQAKPVVGFYKDRGKTKPITKSVAELNRKKIIQGSQRFKGVGVVPRLRDVGQQLEDLLGELHLTQDHLLLLSERQKELVEQGKISLLDKEIEKTNGQIATLKNRIRILGT
jgi:hypothetical protein